MDRNSLSRDIPSLPQSEITPEHIYRLWQEAQQISPDRRQFLANSSRMAMGAIALASAGGVLMPRAARAAMANLQNLPTIKSPLSIDEKPTDYDKITSYNNFYEFGTDKGDPVVKAKNFNPTSWNLTIDGLVTKPITLDLDQIMKFAPLEERVYRMRCVEGWSMVIPWVGFPLAKVIDRAKPLGSAKYVAFTSLADPAQMPALGGRVLQWPYVEGLRLDEAKHPLSLMAVGLYGKSLPGQNGAPLRLVVPWKYGFKGIKSIVRISFTDTEPPTSWNRYAAQEYGFYSNVNPSVDHPRWSQKSERRIGEFSRRPTLMFNGYGDQVASLYSGMDLAKYF